MKTLVQHGLHTPRVHNGDVDAWSVCSVLCVHDEAIVFLSVVGSGLGDPEDPV